MPKDRVIRGDRPPSFMSKTTLAAELDVSECTVDSYVQRGLLPKPVLFGRTPRWNWAEVFAALSAQSQDGDDPFMSGLKNV